MRISDWSSDVCSSVLLLAPGFELCENRLGALYDTGGNPRQPRDRQAITAVRGSLGNLVEQHQVALPLTRADQVDRESGPRFGAPRQLLITRCDAAKYIVPHITRHDPSQGARRAVFDGGHPTDPP